jgi:maltooligosyltrehalose trehalohydrolase
MSASGPPSNLPRWRRYPIGVELSSDGRIHARVWAPRRSEVELVLLDDHGSVRSATQLSAEGGGQESPGAGRGFFSGYVGDAGAGSLYRFRLDGGEAYPDPVSRFQPDGPHGSSQVIDPARFAWQDSAWRGVRLERQVLQELHIGTFTEEGTFHAATKRLTDLADVGISCVEVMPVADFPGRFGWGYDGVNMFAPTRLYGAPDDFRAFVDRAHALGMGVILDVVYNHLGPDGNYLREFAAGYFSAQYKTEWGEAINFDGDDSGPVREFFLCNAEYWVEEFHVDGLRLDATHQIFDHSRRNILKDVCERVRRAAKGRATLIIGENELQRTELMVPAAGDGAAEYGLDALWNDDFHHSAKVAVTGRNDAYFSGFRGSAQELVSTAKYGYLYQGQWSTPQKGRRGTPTFGISPMRFVNFIDNHDQVANSGRGDRLHGVTSAGRYRAATALLLLLPQTPMLFQGQEFAANAPFLFFADHGSDLLPLVRQGRAKFLAQFASLVDAESKAQHTAPDDAATFRRCKLDWRERDAHDRALALHRDLLRLRREDPVLQAQLATLDGTVMTEQAFAIRYFGGELGDRLLVVNMGRRLHFDPAAEPLLAPPRGQRWVTRWSSEEPCYGGWGTPPVDADGSGWSLPAECAVVLFPQPHEN